MKKGSFFAPHRDSEKVDGMFGTLVIVLPSQFAGGKLIVNHKGEVKTFDQSSLSSFKTQYAAFYSPTVSMNSRELPPVIGSVLFITW
jgi:hypothetical protein